MKHKKKIIIQILALISFAYIGFASVQDEDGEKTASFNVQKGGKLEVKVDYGGVTIIPWDKNEVFVRAAGFDEDELEQIKIKGDKNHVTVKLLDEDSHGGDGYFEINVPSEFDVGFSTGGGNIEIKGDLKGSVDGSSGGGNIILKNIMNGHLNLSTGGGDIRAGSIGGDVTLSTGGGNIDIDDIIGDVKASTGGGNITLGKANGVADISTGGGNINLDGAGGDVRLSTGGGNIDVKNISGKVRVSTGGGTVDLREITGAITASTGGGDITAELISSGKGDSKLSTGGGDIKLYVSEKVKATVEATIEIHRKWSKNIKKYKIVSDFKTDSYEEDKDEEEVRGIYLINGGGDKIRLSTSNSNIKILKK